MTGRFSTAEPQLQCNGRFLQTPREPSGAASSTVILWTLKCYLVALQVDFVVQPSDTP
jgi:hypothetical protein